METDKWKYFSKSYFQAARAGEDDQQQPPRVHQSGNPVGYHAGQDDNHSDHNDVLTHWYWIEILKPTIGQTNHRWQT